MKNNNKILNFFPLYKVWTQKTGINSEVMLCHHYRDSSYKILVRFGKSKGGFELSEAITMIDNIKTYYRLLKKRGILTPAIDRIFLEYKPDKKKAIIVKESDWTGNDLAKLIKKCSNNDDNYLESLISDMIAMIAKVWNKNSNNWEVQVGIDPNCSNFTVDKEGLMWFVDLFPPRLQLTGKRKAIVEWPNPHSVLGRNLGHFKHFDIRGIILCTLFQLSRQVPKKRLFFETLVLRELQKYLKVSYYDQFIKELMKMPWIEIRYILNHKFIYKDYRRKIKQIINNCLEYKVFGVNYYVYHFREIALEFTCVGLMNKNQLDDFFKKTHFEDKMPINKINSFKKELFKYLA